MNIFVLDSDITTCAEYHCDKHVVKMCVEYAQLLCTAHHILSDLAPISIPYKQTHPNHPSAIWVRESKANYEYLLSLGFALCAEYTYRYHKIHKCQSIFEWCLDNMDTLDIPDIEMTVIPQAMPLDVQTKHDGIFPVQAYRKYYMKYKSSFAKWKFRAIPDFMCDSISVSGVLYEL